MIRALKWAAALLIVATAALAEDIVRIEVSEGAGAVLRGLDKTTGVVQELRLAKGETVGLEWLQITLGDCRYPKDNLAGDAFAWLVIRERNAEQPLFEGWMVASSPALNALDHPRFDVWVIRCTTE